MATVFATGVAVSPGGARASAPPRPHATVGHTRLPACSNRRGCSKGRRPTATRPMPYTPQTDARLGRRRSPCNHGIASKAPLFFRESRRSYPVSAGDPLVLSAALTKAAHHQPRWLCPAKAGGGRHGSPPPPAGRGRGSSPSSTDLRVTPGQPVSGLCVESSFLARCSCDTTTLQPHTLRRRCSWIPGRDPGRLENSVHGIRIVFKGCRKFCGYLPPATLPPATLPPQPPPETSHSATQDRHAGSPSCSDPVKASGDRVTPPEPGFTLQKCPPPHDEAFRNWSGEAESYSIVPGQTATTVSWMLKRVDH